MRIYHGTSFANACKILDEQIWKHPDERFADKLYNRGRFKPMHDMVLKSKEYGILGIYFTTNVYFAASYANLNEKPVVLFTEDDTLSYPCRDFIVPSIETKGIKAYEGLSDKIRFYGSILNALYYRKKYVSSTQGCILGANSKNEMSRIASCLKDSIEEAYFGREDD